MAPAPSSNPWTGGFGWGEQDVTPLPSKEHPPVEMKLGHVTGSSSAGSLGGAAAILKCQITGKGQGEGSRGFAEGLLCN